VVLVLGVVLFAVVYEGDDRMAFGFLHISDIHFGDESTSGWVSRNKILEIIREANLKANCLVISGDLFNRGSLSKDRLKDYKDFLDQLPGHLHILTVPGNHDLDRSAQKCEDESYNVFTTRRSVVFNSGEKVKIPGGEFRLTNREKPVLYEMAFQAFQLFSQKMGFQSFCQPSAPLTAENYEVQIVDMPFDDRSVNKVRFVLLNTALIASQSVRGEKYRRRQIRLEKAYQCAYMAEAELYLNQGDYPEAIVSLRKGIEKIAVAPQCCMKLADLYLELGEYGKVEEYARKGILAATQDQPTVSIGYLYYLLALAMDAERIKRRQAGEIIDAGEIYTILTAYHTADKLFVNEGRSTVSYRSAIEAKLIIIEMEEGLSEKTDIGVSKSKENRYHVSRSDLLKFCEMHEDSKES